jgi:hypothetical protein
MARFFKSPSDLVAWVKNLGANKAATAIANIPKAGSSNLMDIAETTKRICEANDANAAETLFNLLKSAGVANDDVEKAEAAADHVQVANDLLKRKVISNDEYTQMVKQAQIMRQPGEYDMPLRICPKLPMSVGKKLISTYNCRHYCLDGIVLDDDPMRVYCGELLWRQHVAQKFSSEYQDRKTGEWVGGYINDRFYKFPDAGTPGNPDVARDGGNPMSLKPGERTRMPRPHQWSTERRMQEAREKNSTKDHALGKTASGWMGRVIEAQVHVEDFSNNVAASGYISKVIKGIPFEINWELTESQARDDMSTVSFEWPENALRMVGPADSDGSVVDPSTGAVLIDGLERENMESLWEDEVLDQVFSQEKSASSSVRIVKAQSDSGLYVNFSFDPEGNLVMTPTQEGVSEALEYLKKNDQSDNAFLDMIEDHLGSGWELVKPEEIGALTSALIISNSVVRDDNGQITDIGDVWSNIADYQVKSEIEEFAKGNPVIFGKASSETEAEPKTASLKRTIKMSTQNADCKCNLSQTGGTKVEAKKKGWKTNPQAVCHAVIDKNDNPEKFEKCVQHVKSKCQAESDESVARKVLAQSGQMTKIASSVTTVGEEDVVKAFSMAVELHAGGVAADDAVIKVAAATGLTLGKATVIHEMAVRKMAAHTGEKYITDKNAKPKGPQVKTDQEVQQDADELALTNE